MKGYFTEPELMKAFRYAQKTIWNYRSYDKKHGSEIAPKLPPSIRIGSMRHYSHDLVLDWTVRYRPDLKEYVASLIASQVAQPA